MSAAQVTVQGELKVSQAKSFRPKTAYSWGQQICPYESNFTRTALEKLREIQNFGELIFYSIEEISHLDGRLTTHIFPNCQAKLHCTSFFNQPKQRLGQRLDIAGYLISFFFRLKCR